MPERRPAEHSHGRYIERSEFEGWLAANEARVTANRELYRKRQSVLEHPFGTIKRSWGYTYTLLRTMEKVEGEFALIFTAYNLRRSMSILGAGYLIGRLKGMKNSLKGLCFWEMGDELCHGALQYAFRIIHYQKWSPCDDGLCWMRGEAGD